MPFWIYIVLFVGLLLGIGGWVDWRRRYSGGGDGMTPLQARRDAQARGPYDATGGF